MNPFWLQPQMETTLESLQQETQFVLYVTERKEQQFVAALLLVDARRGVRASLFGRKTCVALRLENGRCEGLRVVDVEGMAVCVLGMDVSPYEAVRRAVEAAAEIVGEFCSRNDKLSSALWADKTRGIAALDRLGYCTWDAFRHEVTEDMVVETVRWLESENVKVGYVIVDDGWQGGGGGGPDCVEDVTSGGGERRPRLSSFGANDKFSGSLRNLGKETGIQVIAWATIIGYWGGCDGESCGVRTCRVRGRLSVGLHANDLKNSARWENEYELVKPAAKDLDEFFERYYVQSLALEQGVSGVKVDAQSILEILCNVITTEDHVCGRDDVQMTRGLIVASYRTAMMKAVERAFPNSMVFNCMGCGSESILLSGKKLNRGNICWRASDDHAFPGVEENLGAVSWHILCNAINTVLLGEIFPVMDWDMFRAADESVADIHAAARVLSGGPVYISDATPFSGENNRARALLASLTTTNGRLLRCVNPGRPTIDSLFKDPRLKPGKLFKIFNRTAVLSVVGLFNLDSSEDGYDVQGSFAPVDVEDIARVPGSCRKEYISLVVGTKNFAFRHRGSHDEVSIKVPPMTAVLAHICPVFEVADGIKLAVLGQPRLLNCGASVASISVSRWRGQFEGKTTFCVTFECCLEDYGETYVWLSQEGGGGTAVKAAQPDGNLLEQRVLLLDGVRFIVVDIPDIPPYGFRLSFMEDDSATNKNNNLRGWHGAG